MCRNKIHRFNLVEITLAIAILAFGMANVLYLFPLGVNTAKNAAADNQISDVAYYMMGYVSASVDHYLDDPNDTTHSNRLRDYFGTVLGNALGNTQPNLTAPQTYNTANNSTDKIGTNLFKCGTAGRFLYVERPGNTNDPGFSCEIAMWQSDVPISFRSTYASSAKTSTTDSSILTCDINASYDFERMIYMEISWPFEAPYSEREKRIYVFDAFNSNDNIVSVTDNPGVL